MVANGSMLCALHWSFGVADVVDCEGTRVFDFSGTAALQSVQFIAATPGGTSIVVVGVSTDGSSRWLLVAYNFTTRQRTVFRATTVEGGEVLHCTTEASEESIICFIYNRVLNSVMLKRIRLTNGGAVVLSEAVVDASLDANATAMGIDPAFDTGFVAYNFALQPSRVLTFRLSTLLPVGSFDLSGFYVVTSLSINSADRLLLGVMEDEFSKAFLTLNLFGISAVVPNIVDLAGGALITVKGEGFDVNSANDTWCIVSGVEIEATLVDAGTITCIAPQASNSLSACVTDTIDVRFGSRSTSQRTIGILRPVSAGLISAQTEYGTDSYGSYDLPSNVTITGFGFVNSPYAKCRLINLTNGVVFVGRAYYINSTNAVCEQPTGLPPTDTWSGIQYSHDGTYFGASAALFIIVGPTKHVLAVPDNNTVVSSTNAKLFGFSIYTADLFFNRRLMLESRQDSVRCSSNIPDLAIINAPEVINFTAPSMLQVPLAVGVARFDHIWLQRPIAGDYTMYCFSFGDTTVTTNFTFSVVPGPPAAIAYFKSQSWYAGVRQDITVLPRPTAWLTDVSGNHITDLAQLPTSMTLSTLRANVIGSLIGYNTSKYISLPDDAGFYTFDGVVVRTAFDVPTNLVLATGFGIPADTIPLPQETCISGVEYSMPSTMDCIKCPVEAYCDGTSLLRTRPGYWRGTRTSLEFYECVPSDACPSSSVCKDGFTGRKCATCVDGYGQSLDGCAECWPSTISWLLNVFAFCVVCFVILHTSVLNMDITSLEDFQLRTRFNQVNEERVNALVIKILQSHMQMLTAVPFSQLPLPVWLKSLFATSKSSASADPNLVFITCSVAPTAADQLTLAVVLIPVLMFVFTIVAAIVAYMRSNINLREEEELQYRIDMASGKIDMDARVERAYQDVQQRRRARQARRFAYAKAKADHLHRAKAPQSLADEYDSDASGEDLQESMDHVETPVQVIAPRLLRPPTHSPSRRQSSSNRAPLPPLEPQRINEPRGTADDGNNFNALVPSGATGDKTKDHSEKTEGSGHKKEFNILDFDEVWDNDKIRRMGYEPGLMATDPTRQVRAIRVLADHMKLSEGEEEELVRQRVRILVGEDEDDIAQMLQELEDAKETNAATRRADFSRRFINVFLVCTLCILFELYPTLMEYSSKVLQCETLQVEGGNVTVMRTNPEVSCASAEYYHIQVFSWAILAFSVVGIPVIMSLFIVVVARTTCRVDGVGSFTLLPDRVRRARLVQFETTSWSAVVHPFRTQHTSTTKQPYSHLRWSAVR